MKPEDRKRISLNMKGQMDAAEEGNISDCSKLHLDRADVLALLDEAFDYLTDHFDVTEVGALPPLVTIQKTLAISRIAIAEAYDRISAEESDHEHLLLYRKQDGKINQQVEVTKTGRAS